MSIQVRERKKGKVYVVHYYDGETRTPDPIITSEDLPWDARYLRVLQAFR